MSRFNSAAYGGPGWSPRTESMRQEIGRLWGACGVASEWAPLKAVLLHRPGAEWKALGDANKAQMMASPDLEKAEQQHDAMALIYGEAGVTVHYVEPPNIPPPNLLFVADLMLGTPEGVILGRPASTVRAGEERLVGRRLAELGIPILRSVRGRGTFEGADATWLDSSTVLLATGLRTNAEGAEQVTSLLEEMGVTVILVGLPYGAMHLMGTFRLVDRDLAVAWRGRVPYDVVKALRERDITVLFLPDEAEAAERLALNIVPLAPRSVLMPAGVPVTEAFYRAAGIECHMVQVDELLKAAGGPACMTGVLERETV